MRRTLILLRARLASARGGGAPVAALLFQAIVATFFCALVRDALVPFSYALCAFSLTGALVAIPLLGELGWLLRRDPAEDWARTQPARDFEHRLARTAHLLVVLGCLALGSLIPAAFFAPDSTGVLGKLLLPVAGLGFVTLLAAILLLVQSLCGERAEGLLVAFQTVLVVTVVLGVVLGVRSLGVLARLPEPADQPGLFALPPAWFAAPFADPSRWPLAVGAGTVGLLLVVLLPPSASARVVRRPWLAVLLHPARLLATRSWVRRDERGAFDLVFDALPREREVVLRTVPMVGIPIALFLISTLDGDAGTRRDIVAISFFTAGIYLPILLTHVQATRTPAAAWLHRTAPVSDPAIAAGALKALAVHFLLPLYGLLALVALGQIGARGVLELAPVGYLASLALLRRLYPVCVQDAPLSTAPDEVRFDQDWIGRLGGYAILSVGLALLTSRAPAPGTALALLAVLALFERFGDRRDPTPRG